MLKKRLRRNIKKFAYSYWRVSQLKLKRSFEIILLKPQDKNAKCLQA